MSPAKSWPASELSEDRAQRESHCAEYVLEGRGSGMRDGIEWVCV